jgi:predicted permease
MEIFIETFGGTFRAVLQLFIVALGAGILVRRKLISQEQVKAISAVTVRVLLPCLIFASIIKQFQPGQLRIWPIIPLVAVGIICIGLLAGAGVFSRELGAKRNMLTLCSIQNAAYVPLPVGSILFPDEFEKFKLYCFLYILGVTPILWSLGKYLISSTPGVKIKFRELITPPFVANILAIALVLTRLRIFVPLVLVDSIELIGSATVPVAIFILGAVLGGISFRPRAYLPDAARVIAVKMVLVPVCTIFVLYLTGLAESFPLLASFFVIEASSAPATAAVIQVKHYGGDEQKVGSIVLLSYLFCVIAMPFWVAVWRVVSG